MSSERGCGKLQCVIEEACWINCWMQEILKDVPDITILIIFDLTITSTSRIDKKFNKFNRITLLYFISDSRVILERLKDVPKLIFA